MNIIKARKNPNNYHRSLTRGFRACVDGEYKSYALVAWDDKNGTFDAYYYSVHMHPLLVPSMAEKILTYAIHANTEGEYDED